METKNFENWEEFEGWLRENKSHLQNPLGFLFRGQSDSKYGLETTLERHLREVPLPESSRQQHMSMLGYFGTLLETKPFIESYTGQVWKLPEYDEYEKRLEKEQQRLVRAQGNSEEWQRIFDLNYGKGFRSSAAGSLWGFTGLELEFMTYVRHHNFPSPLLDWTKSPYIAAHFAFRHAKENIPVSIFALKPTGYKFKAGTPLLTRLNSDYIKNHKRHFQQQSAYTICNKLDELEVLCFCSHEEAFSKEGNGLYTCWKFNIPGTEKTKVLRQLDLVNINAYSLFQSEESLYETAAYRMFRN